MLANPKNTRRYTRFKSDPSTVGLIDVENRNGKFQPTHHALVLNESFQGCCVVASSVIDIRIGQLVMVKVGELDPVPTEVRWVFKLDDEVFKLGLFYIE